MMAVLTAARSIHHDRGLTRAKFMLDLWIFNSFFFKSLSFLPHQEVLALALLSPAPILQGEESSCQEWTQSDLLYICKGAPGWHPHCLIYTTWHTSLQKTSQPASGSLSTPCPVSFVHAAWAEGHSAHSFKAGKAALWGGRAHPCRVHDKSQSWPMMQVFWNKHILLFIFSSPQLGAFASLSLARFSSLSSGHTCSGQLPMGQGVSQRHEKWDFPWEIPSTWPPCSLLHGTQLMPRAAAQGWWAITSGGELKNRLVFPHLEKNQLVFPWSITASRTAGFPH